MKSYCAEKDLGNVDIVRAEIIDLKGRAELEMRRRQIRYWKQCS